MKKLKIQNYTIREFNNDNDANYNFVIIYFYKYLKNTHKFCNSYRLLLYCYYYTILNSL